MAAQDPDMQGRMGDLDDGDEVLRLKLSKGESASRTIGHTDSHSPTGSNSSPSLSPAPIRRGIKKDDGRANVNAVNWSRHRSGTIQAPTNAKYKDGRVGYKMISMPALVDDELTGKKRFLFRLLYELQTSGNFGFRTEKYVHKIGMQYNVYCVCGVYPRTATVTFQFDHSESYTFELSSGYNFSKLELLDQLVFDICYKKPPLPFDLALIRLAEIEKMGSYPWQTNLAAFAVASSTSTIIFFGGSWLDGAWAVVMGIVVCSLNHICTTYTGLSEIEAFISSFSIALMTSLLDLLVYSDGLCLYGVMFGAVVWLLPGVTITVSLIELYSKMITYGATKLVYSISFASQIGFGLTLGYKVGKVTDGIPWSFINGCRAPTALSSQLFLLPLNALSFSVLMNGSRSQHGGVVLICGIGQMVSLLASYLGIGDDAIPFLAAMCITAGARLYTHYCLKGRRPLVYIIAGLLVLVPGGVAVRGMSSIWQDASTGLEFTVKMLMIGVSLAIGVFVALLPFPLQRVDKGDEEKFDGHEYEATLNPLGRENNDIEAPL